MSLLANVLAALKPPSMPPNAVDPFDGKPLSEKQKRLVDGAMRFMCCSEILIDPIATAAEKRLAMDTLRPFDHPLRPR